MTINRTTLLDLPLPVTGTESGTWGDAVNNGLTQYVDIAVAGMTSLTSSDFAAGALSLSLTEGNASATNIAASSAQYGAIKVSSLAQASTITAPSSNRRYVIINADSTYNVTIKASGQSGVAIVPGEKALVAFNGTDYVKVGGAAGGSTTQVQFNNAGVFGGITNATTDGTTLSMTSPKVITSINDTNGNELLKVTATASAVNEVTVANAATGNNPVLSATGNDTNIGINLTPKGSGAIKLSGLSYPTADGSPNQAIVTNGSGTLSFATIASLSGQTDSASPYETALGSGAGAVSTGVNNTFVGFEAGNDNTTGTNNTAVGYQALDINTIGTFNTAVGSAALGANTTGASNTAVGYQALYTNSTASNNTAIGYAALTANTTGGFNVAVGTNSLVTNTSGGENNVVGYAAMQKNTTGSKNVAMGVQALQENTTASNNVAIGYFALNLNTTGTSNTAVGFEALKANTTGGSNTAVGYQALKTNNGDANTAFGGTTLLSNTTGINNVAVGNRALENNNTGSNNTALGRNAMFTNTTGADNTAVGYQAMYLNNGGTNNVAVGDNALYSNTTGTDNVAVGYQALDSNTTGNQNTAVGVNALGAVTTGATNVAVGYGAGSNITTQSYSTMIGANATAASTSSFSEIVVCSGGGYAGKGSNTGFIQPNGGGVYQGNNSSSWSTTSDQRLKKNIVDNTDGLDKITQIRVRNFEYRTADEVTELPANSVIDKQGIQLGVIAQELQQVCPDCVKEESTGVLSVDSDNVFWHMVNAIKDLKAIVDAQAARILALEGN